MQEDNQQSTTLLDRIDRTLNSDNRWIYLLFGVGFFLKLIYVLQTADSIHVTVPILDSEYYDTTAQDIAKGNVVRKDAFFMGPLYSYFLAFIYSAVGRNFMLIRIIQIIGGSLTIVLTFLIGKRVFRPSTAFIAALMLAFYGTSTFYEGQLLMMWMGTLLNMSMLYILLRRRDGGGTKKYLLLGFLLGLSALARANVLIFLPVILIWILLTDVSRKKAAALAIIVMMGLTILPATIHNFVASSDFVPITHNGGVNFYIGNSPPATGIFYPPDGVDFVTDASTRGYVERILGRDLGPSDVSRFWYERSFDFIREHPAKELALLLRKTALIVNGYEIPQIESYNLMRGRYGTLRILFVNYWFLISLAIVGMLYSLKRWKNYFLLYGYVISLLFSIVLFFVTARYRIQVAPVLCMFAAYAIVEIFPRAFRSLRRAYVPVVMTGVLLILTQPSIFALPKEDVLWREHIHQARRLNETGKFEEALTEVNKAIEIHPKQPDSYVHRAVIYKKHGRFLQAIDNYEKALNLAPNKPEVHYDLAQTLKELKLYEAAIAEYNKAIELDPVMIEAYNNIGITYRDMRRYDRAVMYFEKVIEMDPKYIKAYNNLGASLGEDGKVDRAVEVLQAAIELDPSYANAHKNLARVYVQQQKIEDAIESIERYLTLNPDDAHMKGVLDQLQFVVDADTTRGKP
jgi:tetratricopeptide (TPR) repeat protein